MRTRVFGRRHALIWAVIIVVAGASRAGAQALPLFGVWKLSPAKSTIAGPAPLDTTLIFAPLGANEVTGGEDTIYLDGSKTMTRYTTKVDGQDVPISASPVLLTHADSIAMTRLGPSLFSWTYKKSGIAVLVLRGVISPNGRTLTMTASAPATEVLVYEKQ